jgi:hypothetical protein
MCYSHVYEVTNLGVEAYRDLLGWSGFDFGLVLTIAGRNIALLILRYTCLLLS